MGGVNRFSFSYHGIGKHDNFTNVKGTEERLRNAIAWINEERKYNAGLYAKIGTLFDGKNIDDIENMLDYAESYDMDLYIEIVDYFIPIFKGTELSKRAAITNQDKEILHEALEKIETWVKKGRRVNIDRNGIQFIYNYYMGLPIKGICPLGLTDIYIESNGDVRTGCWSFEPVGNIRSDSLINILNSKAYEASVEKMIKRDCQGCTCGYLMQAKYMEY